ncbi:RWD domain-containing protein 3 isoform X3 [Varanus komodoensis]|uniref:RWD domain-containing protein 3 isoform X3 n=1 Tax=Varanus komodoensis TaxID=61221 RepID=UPI001CF7A657|nr:RWD domain-containing protein 3 isoform X3 [Varanus komodoensis]
MSELALEELSAIAAIYSGKDECEVLQVSEGISFRIQTHVEGPLGTDVLLQLLFHLPISYPTSLPNISVNSEQLTRTQCMAVRGRLLEEAERHFSQLMVHELILWIQQNLKHVVEQAGTSVCSSGKSTLSAATAEEDGIWTVLLHLDHMRAKRKYVKTVEKWCADLKLTGRLMLMGKLILILLQGDRRSVKEYIVLQKTSKVDVDSSGKKCKEKMISVLSETKAQAEHRRFQAFEVKEYSTLDELHNEFVAAGLAETFKFYQWASSTGQNHCCGNGLLLAQQGKRCCVFHILTASMIQLCQSPKIRSLLVAFESWQERSGPEPVQDKCIQLY